MRSAFRWTSAASRRLKKSAVAVWTVTGFGILDFGAFQFEWKHHFVGYIAVGVSCLIMGFLVESDNGQ